MKISWFTNLIKNSENEDYIKKTPETERISFSAVENEFHKLTENSKEQSKTIKLILNNIRESVNKMNKATKEVLERLDSIDLKAAN